MSVLIFGFDKKKSQSHFHVSDVANKTFIACYVYLFFVLYECTCNMSQEKVVPIVI